MIPEWLFQYSNEKKTIICMLDVVALIFIFVVITTACLIARTAILGKARKNLRQVYDFTDNIPNDVCTGF